MDFTVQTIEEIENELKAEAISTFNDAGVTLSESTVAEWKLWVSIKAIAIRMVQVIINLFVEEVNNKLIFNRIGTKGWYAAVAKNFEYGNTIKLLPDGSFGYVNPDASKRIIAAVAIVEDTVNNNVKIKVAKDNSGVLVPLLDEEWLAFILYMEAIKILGTAIIVVNYPSDMVKYATTVYYELGYNPDTIKAALLASLETYKSSIGFNGYLYKQKYIDAMMHIPGVVSVNCTLFQSKPSGGAFGDVAVRVELTSGYFNFTALTGTDASAIIMTPISEL